MTEPTLVLKPGREKSALQHHPWIFSGAIASVAGEPQAGQTVKVLSSKKEPLGFAAWSPQSSIAARFWTWDDAEQVDAAFLEKRLQAAWQARTALHESSETTAYRVVHAESDGLPGLVVDRYDNWLVMQVLSTGAEYWRDTIVGLLQKVSGLENVYERSDVDVRKLEGLAERSGTLTGKEPPEFIPIRENGLQYLVDIVHGHKTGFYLDQRNNRARMQALAAGKRVLNCFCYSGGFSVSAAAGMAGEITSVDSSQEAIALGQKNMALNGFTPQGEWVEGDVFQMLRKYRDQARPV